jgi:dipeptidyl aminopeptidase/acylaminoacyl peptidase
VRRHPLASALVAMIVSSLVAAAIGSDSARSHSSVAQPGGKIAFASSDYIGFVSPTGRYLGGLKTADEGRPAWSPDSSRIAYSLIHYEPRTGSDIWVMKANGGARHRLTAHGSDPAWSPDGSRIAFDRDNQVWLMNADGTAQRLLARHASSPSWSPDGTRIAFVSGALGDNNDEVAVMKVDGSNKRALMKAGGQEPSWSPDGSKLVYVVGTSSYLFVVNADGSGAHRLFPAPPEGLCDCFGPAWSRG